MATLMGATKMMIHVCSDNKPCDWKYRLYSGLGINNGA